MSNHAYTSLSGSQMQLASSSKKTRPKRLWKLGRRLQSIIELILQAIPDENLSNVAEFLSVNRFQRRSRSVGGRRECQN